MSNESSKDIQSSYHSELTQKPLGIRFKHYLTRFRSEIVLSVLAVILACGQYVQSIHQMRLEAAVLWREGYTSDTRNCVNKFILFYEIWQKNDPKAAENSLDILIDPNKVFNGQNICNDDNLLALLDDDLAEKRRELRTKDKEGKLEPYDYVAAAEKYRNAIIECLNTMEAVKAVIQAGRWFGINLDTIGKRYDGVIGDLTRGLRPFIDRYNECYKRPTPAWLILIEPDSRTGLLFLIALVVLGLMIWLIYRIKATRNRSRKGGPTINPT